MSAPVGGLVASGPRQARGVGRLQRGARDALRDHGDGRAHVCQAVDRDDACARGARAARASARTQWHVHDAACRDLLNNTCMTPSEVCSRKGTLPRPIHPTFVMQRPSSLTTCTRRAQHFTAAPAATISALDAAYRGSTRPGQSHSVSRAVTLSVWKCLVLPALPGVSFSPAW